MEKVITGVRTAEGTAKIDYQSLANLPQNLVTTDNLKEQTIGSAQNAETANTAKSADTAKVADSAKTAEDSAKLDGHAASYFATAGHSHNNYLPIYGSNGIIKLKENVHYGTSTPSTGEVGQIFFVKV